MYRQTVEPILAAAGFEVVAHETRWRGHASEIVAGEAVGAYEAVVAVGGDGTVFEVLQVMRMDSSRSAAGVSIHHCHASMLCGQACTCVGTCI